jgi:NADP-dependent 3-hydroxy acid dehydrogenase YdfG
MAAALAKNGAKVYIASRNMQRLEQVALEIKCIPLQADLTTKTGCMALASEMKRRETVLHVLINNSGVAWGDQMMKFNEPKGWSMQLIKGRSVCS